MNNITSAADLNLSVYSIEPSECVARVLGAMGLGGDVASDGEAFQALKAELEKLTGLYSQRVDWHLVETLALSVLEERREISAAVWLGCAWFKCRGLPGLVDACDLWWQLFDLHWETMNPPVARLRARRNQLLWLLDFLHAELKAEFEALEPSQWEQLQNRWQAIAGFWQRHDEQPVDFSRVLLACQALPCVAVQGALQPVQEAVLSELESESPPAVVCVTVPEALNALVSQCIEQSLLSPLLYRLNRLQAWSGIRQIPEAGPEGSVIPAPSCMQLEHFARVLEGAVAEHILRFCESHLSSLPFWFDLSRASHNALVQLEAFEAAAAVVLEVNELLQRVPALAGQAFANGLPFADLQTQAWLAAVQPELEPVHIAPAETVVDEAVQRIKAAEQLAARGQIGEALSELQRAVGASHAGRDRFSLRLAQCELMQRFGAGAAASALFESLLAEVHRQRLDAWEPALVQQLIALSAKHNNDLSARWLPHLAALDGHAAWMLTAQSKHRIHP